MNKIKSSMQKLMKPIARRIQAWKDFYYIWGGTQRSRYLRMVLAECGDYLKVYGKPVVLEPNKVHIGHHVNINDHVQIAPRADIFISNHVILSRGVQLIGGGMNIDHWADESYADRDHREDRPIIIGEGAWLCANAVILPGVQITGKRVIVAAGAVVTHDITEDCVLVAGVPARIVKRYRGEEQAGH